MPFEQKVEAHHVLKYTGNCKIALQLTTCPFENTVTRVDASGEAMSAADYVGKVKAERTDGSQNRSNPEIRGKNSRRWLIRPNQARVGAHIDKVETFDMIKDPTSKIVAGYAAAMKQVQSEIILGVEEADNGKFVLADGGIMGTSLEGKRPGAAREKLPSKYRTAHNSERLTLDKLINAREVLALSDNSFEQGEVYMAHSPYETTDLLKIAAATESSLNAFEQKQLADGKITSLMGFTFIETNMLPTVSGARWCPIWTKSNILAGYWQDIKTYLWNNPAQQNLPYAFMDLYLDVVRGEDASVHVIETQVAA
ncbi:MAG: hypothetical protein JKY93_03600 [Gammaproteobacteria bacterium]|nr:hypothetical protein [Gammaproteobacteria bacterium]